MRERQALLSTKALFHGGAIVPLSQEFVPGEEFPTTGSLYEEVLVPFGIGYVLGFGMGVLVLLLRDLLDRRNR
jgi:hypothetical protein